MHVNIKYIERTCLKEKPFIKLIKKYAKTKSNILVVFDKRYKNYGGFSWNPKKKINEIRLGIKANKYSNENTKLSCNSEKYNFISTILHEIKHMNQREELGKKFWDKNYYTNKDLKNAHLSVEFSKCELEAKEFEAKNVLQSVKYYDSLIEDGK